MGCRPLDQLEVLGGLGSWGWGHRAEPWVRALAQPPSISAGVVQSIKDHITKPTAMARGRVAHLIEWKGWSAQQAGWELTPADDEHYCHLPEELCEARFAAGQRGRGWGTDWPGLVLRGPRVPPVHCRGVLSHFSRVQLLWTVAHQAPLSMGFSRQRILSGLPFPTPGDLSDPGFQPVSLTSPALAGGFFTTGLGREIQC